MEEEGCQICYKPFPSLECKVCSTYYHNKCVRGWPGRKSYGLQCPHCYSYDSIEFK